MRYKPLKVKDGDGSKPMDFFHMIQHDPAMT